MPNSLPTPYVQNVSSAADAGALHSVWLLLVGCGVASVLIFFYIWRMTRQSARALRDDVSNRLRELRDISADAHHRFQRIDQAIVHQRASLSARGSEAYSMAKQITSKIAARMQEVQYLQSGSLDKLVRAQEILDTPLDNTGVQYDAIVFADTILTLKPDQFSLATSMILDIVEQDLQRKTEVAGPVKVAPPMHSDPRGRKFTIRGFLRSLTTPKD